MEFFSHQTDFKFMATRHVWYGLSAILMIASIVMLFTRGLNLAIDFTGGVSVQATFPVTADLGAVRTQLAAAGFRDPQVQNFGSSRNIAIRLPPAKMRISRRCCVSSWRRAQAVNPGATLQQLVGGRTAGGQSARDERGLGARFHAAPDLPLHRLPLSYLAAVLRRDSRGAARPDPGARLVRASQTSFDLAVVAAILAVIGYSLNDTVVVFDRIRERFESNRRLAPDIVLDQSINQTLSRTIMTKVVTSIVVVALLILGGPVLKGFSEALLIGILAGTYSSIYISSAVALECGLTAEHIFPSIKKTAAR